MMNSVNPTNNSNINIIIKACGNITTMERIIANSLISMDMPSVSKDGYTLEYIAENELISSAWEQNEKDFIRIVSKFWSKKNCTFCKFFTKKNPNTPILLAFYEVVEEIAY